jgi:ADP-ribose pyrophosphatase
MTTERGPEHPRVEILQKEIGYEGFFRLERYHLRHRLYSGEMSPLLVRELFERGHAAAVLLYDPQRDAVVVLEQFRIGALEAPGGPWLFEIVAGMIEPGEHPAEVARREALEEAGCHIEQLLHICDYLVSPGGTSEQISLYCGLVDSEGVEGIYGNEAEHEDIRVCSVPFDELWQWFVQGQLNSASPIIALQWLAMRRELLRKGEGQSGLPL